MKIITFIGSSGQGALERLRTLVDMTTILYDIITRLLFNKDTHISQKQIINQILFIGLDALPVIALIAIILGFFMGVQLLGNIEQIGADNTIYFGGIVSLVSVREVGPLITAVVVIGRSGAALTTFLGNMKVTKEIAALDAMGVSLIDYLIIPSFFGMIISLVCLNFYFAIIAILGTIIGAHTVSQIPVQQLWYQIVKSLSMVDILISLIKGISAGVLISVTSCYYGLSVGSVRIVPRAVFRTVVLSILSVITINVTINILKIAFKKFIIYVF